MPFASASEPPRKRRTSVLRSKTLAEGGFTPPEHFKIKEVPIKSMILWGGQEEDAEFGDGTAADRGIYGGFETG